MAFQLPSYTRVNRPRSINHSLVKNFKVGDVGFYEIDKGFGVVRLVATIVKIQGIQLTVHVTRGNGREERKTISPKNFKLLQKAAA